MRTTYFGEVVAIQPGQYTVYVFKNLDEPKNSLLRYISTTVLPNWNCEKLSIGDTGYFECEYVNAGDPYFKVSTGNMETYNYTVCYLINFIKKQTINNTKEFNF